MNLWVERIIAISAEGATSLISWSWQAAILLSCVWLALKISRIKSPALSHQFWLLGLIFVAGLPILSGILQSLPLPQKRSTAITYAVDLPRMIVTTEAVPIAQNRLPAVMAQPTTNWPLILGALFLVWLIGLCITFTRAVIHAVKLHRLRKNARLSSLPELDCAEFNSLLHCRVSIGLSDNVSSPILLGLFRPMIVMPADIVNWTSPGERHAILHHELAHVARRDQYIHLFQILIGMIFYFHPVVWYACRQMSLERELACDDRVVIHGTEAETYAESIVKVAERNISLARVPSGAHQLAIFNSRQMLERRIEMILNKDRVRVIAHHWKYVVPAAVVLGILVWMIIPQRPTTAHQLQKQFDEAKGFVKDGSMKELLARYMADSDKYNEIVSTVLTSPDANLREQALHSLVDSQGEWATEALGEILDKSRDLSLRRNLIEYLGQRNAWSKLQLLATEEPNVQLRQLALQRLLELEGAGSADALVELYGRVHDKATRENIIRSLGRRGEIDGLTIVGDTEIFGENDQGLIRLNFEQLEWIVANHDSVEKRRKASEWLSKRRQQAPHADQDAQDAPPPPPPPPPPPWNSRTLNDPAEIARLLREEPNEATIVIALVRETFDAQIRRDTAFLERVLAEDFQGIGPNGEVFNKEQTIAVMRRLDRQFKKFEVDDFRLKGKEPSIVTNFLFTAYYDENGKETTAQFYTTLNFLKRQGGWEIISCHQSWVR
jgi:beta-lactamase regulating signal transducer with metallopeptidase domain